MKKLYITSLWVISALSLKVLSTGAFADINKWNIINQNVETRPLDQAIQHYTNNLLSFLYLIAVLYAIWWWFLILTAAWNDEKVSKWKTILIQWALWLTVIWLAWTIVKWVLSIFAS